MINGISRCGALKVRVVEPLTVTLPSELTPTLSTNHAKDVSYLIIGECSNMFGTNKYAIKDINAEINVVFSIYLRQKNLNNGAGHRSVNWYASSKLASNRFKIIANVKYVTLMCVKLTL